MGFRIEDAKCVRATEKAILVEAPVLDDDEWIPQSQVDDESEVWKIGDSGVLVVSDWWAEKKGWV